MKRLIYLTMAALMVLATSCKKEKVHYASLYDPIFKAYCLEHFDTDGNGEIDLAEAAEVTEIEVPSMGIKSLDGIASFENLSKLDCSSNLLKDLDVSKNLKLAWLDCRDNKIEVIYIKEGQTITDFYKTNFVPELPLLLTVYNSYSKNNQEASVQESSKPFRFQAKFTGEDIPENVTWESNAPGFQRVTSQVQDATAELNFEKGSDIGDLESGKLYKMFAKAPDGTRSNYVRFGIFGKDPIIYFEKPRREVTALVDETVIFSIFFYPGEGESGTPSIKTIGEGVSRSFNSGVKIQEDEAIKWSQTGKKAIVVYFEIHGKRALDSLYVNVVEGLPEIKILD